MSKTFKQFVTPHCHHKSIDSASTPERLAKREDELGSGHVTITDHGTLEGTRQVYDLCHDKKKYKGKLTPILGLEAYFRDDDCPILKDLGIEKVKDKYLDYVKYMHLTMHFMDQAAFREGSILLTKADDRAEIHGAERKQLFDWSDIERLGAQNTTMTSSCLVGMVGRHLIRNKDVEAAKRYYEKVRGLVKPGNFYVELFPHSCEKNWEMSVLCKYEDGTEQKFKTHNNLMTSAGKIKAEDLAHQFSRNATSARAKYKDINALMVNRKWEPFPVAKNIISMDVAENWIYNECVPDWCPDGDIQLTVNKFVLELAKKYGDKILISDDSHFALPEEKMLQDIILSQHGNWRLSNSYHRMTSQEAFTFLNAKLDINEAEMDELIENTHEWADRFKDFRFEAPKTLPTSFYPKDTLGHTFELIKQNGRMDWTNPKMTERLKTEIEVLHKNGTIDLLPYFMIDNDVVNFYVQNGKLPGPGRGSAGGVLLAYLEGITHVDPLKYGLSFDRFITPDRIAMGKYPDIDQDLPSRDLLIDPKDPNNKGFLHSRFGNCFAQVSNETTLKTKSALKDVFRSMHGKVPDEVEELCNKLPNPPQGISDSKFIFGYTENDIRYPGLIEIHSGLIDLSIKWPEEWRLTTQLLGLQRQRSRHACAYVISDTPIHEIVPLTRVGDVRVTQFNAPGVEAMGLLKMDFLTVLALLDIQECIRLVQDRNPDFKDIDWKSARKFNEIPPSLIIDNKQVPYIRCIPKGGKLYDVWELPDMQEVYWDISSGDTESVFQFNTPTARKWLEEFYIQQVPSLNSIEDLAAFTALDRPGPLDANVTDSAGNSHNMLVEFARRARKEEAIGGLPILDKSLPETYGVIVYQEQLQNIFQKVGESTGIEANNFRQHISKKSMDDVYKDREIFMKGAQKLGKEGEELWGQMVTFGQYGFNKSHAVCYVKISYACAFLKRFYPLEWWTSVMRNAKRAEIHDKFWPACSELVDFPSIASTVSDFEIIDGRIKAPISVLAGVGAKAHKQAVKYAPYSDIYDFCNKIEQHKRDTATISVVEETDEVGQKIRVTKKKAGRSALSTSVISTLIVSGAMDIFFPKEMSVLDRIAEFQKAYEQASGKKIPAKTKRDMIEKLETVSKSKLSLYQLRKKILPTYSEDLRKICVIDDPTMFSIKDGKYGYTHIYDLKTKHKTFNKKKDVSISPGVYLEGFQDAVEEGFIHPMMGMECSFMGYVKEDKRFGFPKSAAEDKKKFASSLRIEVEGRNVELVQWPDYNTGILPDSFKNSLTGSIVIFTISVKADLSLKLLNIKVVKPPLGTEEDTEESKEKSK